MICCSFNLSAEQYKLLDIALTNEIEAALNKECQDNYLSYLTQWEKNGYYFKGRFDSIVRPRCTYEEIELSSFQNMIVGVILNEMFAINKLMKGEENSEKFFKYRELLAVIENGKWILI